MNMWDWTSDMGSSYLLFCWARWYTDDLPAEEDGKDDGDDNDGKDAQEEGANSCADSENDHDW